MPRTRGFYKLFTRPHLYAGGKSYIMKMTIYKEGADVYQSGRAMTSEQLKERIKLLNIVGIALPVFFVAGAAAFFVYAFFAESMLLILLVGVLPCMLFAVFAVGLVRAAKRNVFKDYMAALVREGKMRTKEGEVI